MLRRTKPKHHALLRHHLPDHGPCRPVHGECPYLSRRLCACFIFIFFLLCFFKRGVQHYKQKKQDILWSYRVLPSAEFPAHSKLTPTEIKEAAKHLVDTILKEHSHGSPRMRSDSPEFIGDPDSVNINITSRAEVGGLTCPCNANLKVDREKGLIFTEIYNDLTGVQ